MGEILKFRLSSSPQKTSMYVPFDTTWPKLKSLAFGFLNVDYSETIESIVVVDSNNMDDIVAKWNESNFNFGSLNLNIQGQDLVFVIHLLPSNHPIPPAYHSPLSALTLDSDRQKISSSFSSSYVKPELEHDRDQLVTTTPTPTLDLDFSSPLMIMSNFNKGTFQKLVANEVPVDMKFDFDQTTDFLKCCASGDSTKLMELLKLPQNANVNHSAEGLKGMFMASSLGHLSIVQALHKVGVAIDDVDQHYQISPLNVACLRKHEEVAKWLIDKKCNMSKANIFGATPLHYICFHSMTSLLPVAITKPYVDLVSAGGYSLAHYATGMGCYSVVEHLVMTGADVNTWDSFGNYPLHYSAASGVLESVFLLVEVGKCPVDIVNENGQTPFLVACRAGNLEVAKWLGSPKSKASTRGGGGANVFIEDRDWSSAMHGAAQSGNLELISFLASLGISVTSKSKEGKSPVNLTSDAKVVELLRKLEADKWVKKDVFVSSKMIVDEVVAPVPHEDDDEDVTTRLAIDQGDSTDDSAHNSTDGSGHNSTDDSGHHHVTKSPIALVSERIIDGGGLTKSAPQVLGFPDPINHKNADNVEATAPLVVSASLEAGGLNSVQKSLIGRVGTQMKAHGVVQSNMLQVEKQLKRGAALQANSAAVAHSVGLGSESGRKRPISVSSAPTSVSISVESPAEQGDNGVILHPDPKVDKLFKACLSRENEYIKWYLSQDLDLYVSNENGSQAVHFAAQGGNLEALQLLSGAGVELEVFNRKGVSPMALACKKLVPGAFAMVKWLASQGTEVFSGRDDDDFDFTCEPMHIIASCSFDCVALIEFLYHSCPLVKYNIKLMNKSEEVKWSMLHVAAMHGTVANLKAFFNLGMKVGPRLHETAYTPLHCAVMHAHPSIEMISLIVKHCSHDDILAEDNRGRTAIFLACLLGNFEAVTCIAEAGFNSIGSCNHAGNTCLHVANQSGNLLLVKWLKDNHPELNVKNKQGAWPHDFAAMAKTVSTAGPCDIKDASIVHEAFLTGDVEALRQASSGYDVVEESLEIDEESRLPFLHVMSCGGYVEAVMYLVEKGVPVNVLDYRGWSVLHCAVANGHASLVKFLLFQQGLTVFDTCSDDGSSCLHLAVRGNHTDVAALLLQVGADVNYQDFDGNTPAHIASSFCDLDMIMLLRDHQANFFQENGDLMSVLHEAVIGLGSGEDIDMAEVAPVFDHLLSFGCEIDVRGKNNLTPFHIACVNGNVELCNFLFEGGSNIRLTGGKDELTPVHIAAVKDQLHVVEWLVSRGLRHDAISRDNKTPAEMAYDAGNHDVYDWLLTNAPSMFADRYAECLQEQLFWAIEKNYFKFAGLILQDFLDGAPSLECCNDDGSTLMHAAAAIGTVSLLEGLFERGVDIEDVTVNDHTPLHIACLREHMACVKLLVLLGANVKASDIDGSTCLHMSVIRNNVDITRFFCKLFENADVQNVNGWTPMHYCCLAGENADMLNIFLQRKVNIFKYSFDDETPFGLACKHGHSNFVHAMILHVMNESILVHNDTLERAISIAKEHGFENIAQWLDNVCLLNGAVQEPLPDPSIFTFGHLTVSSDRLRSHSLPSSARKLSDDDEGSMDAVDDNDNVSSSHELDDNIEMFLTAIQSEDFSCVNSFLSDGFDVNSVKASNKMSAIHTACMTGNLMMVQLLANKGANLNSQNIGGLSPLHIACDRQHEDVVIFLLMMGASLTKVCNNGNTVLHMMASRSLCDAIYEIQSRKKQSLCDFGARNKLGQTALHLAVVAGSVDTCEALLALGCPIDNTDFDGQTPLLLACGIDNNALVTLLVSRGANVNHEDAHKKRPLHAACQTGNMLVAHSLIDASAAVNCVTDTGDTLLHMCARSGKLLLLKWMYKLGLDLAAKNLASQTPRECAKLNGNSNVVTWIDATLNDD